MECKAHNVTITILFIFILIETYWNVKQTAVGLLRPAQCILIETYWNVKKRTKVFDWETRDINRDILECKVQQHPSVSDSVNILIETYWNVKFDKKTLYIFPV